MPTPIAAVSSSAPTIRIDGQVSTILTNALISLRIEEDRLSGLHGVFEVSNWNSAGGRPPSFSATIDAHRIGSVVEILFDDAAVFAGRIVGHQLRYVADKPPTAAFLLADALALTRRDMQYRVFEHMSLGDIAANAAQDLGLQVVSSGNFPEMPRLEQRGQSTWELLSEQLARYGLYWWLEGNTIRIAPRTEHSGSSVVPLSYGSSLSQFEATVDASTMPTVARSAHWNAQTAHRTPITVSPDQLVTGIPPGKTGAEIAQAAFGASPLFVDNSGAAGLGLAKDATRATFQSAADAFMVAHATAVPQPAMRVGAGVEIKDVDPWSAGTYAVRSIAHVHDKQLGTRTELILERPSIGYAKAKRRPPVRGRTRPGASATILPVVKKKGATSRTRRPRS